MKVFRTALFYIIIVSSVLVIVLSLLSLIYDLRLWYAKVLDFPRVQYLLVGLVCLLLFVLLNRRWGFASLFLCIGLVSAILIQAERIYPYVLGAKTVPDGSDQLTENQNTVGILVANILMTNRETDTFLQIVAETEPDILLVMETNEWWIKQLQTLKKEYPYVIEHPLDNAYGMALYSRLPLENPSIHFLNKQDVPSFSAKVWLPSGDAFMFYGVHPVAPVPSEKYPDNVGKEEVALLKIGKLVAEDSIPSVVAGDYNDVSWSHTARLFGNEGNLKNVRIGRGLYNTYDANSYLLRWPLDHVFVTKEFAVITLERLHSINSDHFPIFTKLFLKEQKQDSEMVQE